MPQFDSKQAFDALAKDLVRLIPEGLLELIKNPEINIAAIVALASGKKSTLRHEDEEALALLSAIAGSYARWGYGDDPLVTLLQGHREAGATIPAIYTDGGKTCVRPLVEATDEVPFGETLSKLLDEEIETILSIGKKDATVAKWYFTVVSGVLHVNFPIKLSIGKVESFPVASGTTRDLDIARREIANLIVSGGVPSNDAQYETMCKRIASACSPTIVGGWLNLGLYMVSAWEYERRELVRESGDATKIPNIRPVDNESIVDCYACIFDLGPFRLDRVFEINHLCRTKPEAGQHKFEVCAAHVNEAKRLKVPVEPSLAPCGKCGGDYKDHTYDRALGVVLLRDVTQEECKKHLDPMGVAFAADGIDGFAFIETPEQYRVLGEEVESDAD